MQRLESPASVFMASSQVTPEKYEELLDDFIAEYPNSADGYVRRATNRIYRSKDDASMDKVVADMDKALSVAQKKDDVYYLSLIHISEPTRH